MQLLKLVILDVGIKVCTVHGIGIVLVRDRAIFSHAGVPRGYHALAHDAPMVRSRAVIMHMVSGKTPVANLPQGTIVLVMVGQVLIAFETAWERGRGPRLLMFLTREEAKSSLWNCPTFKAIITIFIDPL
jgi:hypothetical protein